ncbi:MAG: hypothetical protein H0V56_14160 [Chthoniobacterales bacterium]|nr:hypothetical protein [Chthoniobacterales bacterium]
MSSGLTICFAPENNASDQKTGGAGFDVGKTCVKVAGGSEPERLAASKKIFKK